MTRDNDEYTTVRLRKSTVARLRAELARIDERLAHDYPGDVRLRRIGTHETAFTRGEERRSADALIVWFLDRLDEKRARSRRSSYKRRQARKKARPAAAPLPD